MRKIIYLVITLILFLSTQSLIYSQKNISYKVFRPSDKKDHSAEFQDFINTNRKTRILTKDTIYLRSIKLRSNINILVDGVICISNNKDVRAVIFHGSNVNNIKIKGKGSIEGRLKNIPKETEITQILHISNSKNISFQIKNILGSNFIEDGQHDTYMRACIQFDSCNLIDVHNIKIVNWGREGIFLNNCNHSSVRNIEANGSDDAKSRSWSAVQVGGDEGMSKNNLIKNIYVNNAGASSVGMNSTYSKIVNIISEGNRHYHGLNLGHPNRPASHSIVKKVFIKDAGTKGPGKKLPYNGLTIAGASKQVKLKKITIINASNNGLMVSNNSDSIQIKKLKIRGAKGYTLNFQKATVFIRKIDIINETNSTIRSYESKIICSQKIRNKLKLEKY